MSKTQKPEKAINSNSKQQNSSIDHLGSGKQENNSKQSSSPIKKMQEKLRQSTRKDQQANSISKKQVANASTSKIKLQIQNNPHLATEISNSKSTSRLLQIKQQKETIQHQLKLLDKEIKEIKEQQRSRSILHKRQEISNNRQAQKMAINLVKHHHEKKKKLKEKKRLHEEKALSLLRQQYEQSIKKREMYESIQRQQKRKVITLRMSEGKKQSESRKQIEKLSNQLVNRLLREEDQMMKKTVESPTQQKDHFIKVVERIPPIDFAEIQRHQSKYLHLKQAHLKKKERSISISYPIKRYEKNKWAEKIEQSQLKLKEEEKQKEIEKKLLLDKRVRYGQLIHSIFMKRNRIRTQTSQQTKIADSQSILATPSKETKQYLTKPLRTRQNDSLPKNYSTASNAKERKQLSPQETQKREERQRQVRKETQIRLRKIQSSNIRSIPIEESKYQSKYQNYLGQVKIKKKQESQIWNQILNSSELSKEQKYVSMLKKAVALENKAKFKQSLQKQSYDEVMGLYIDSIQAKLAVLENL